MNFQKEGKTAIVVFIRSLEEEARIKSFSYKNSQNQTKQVLKELNKSAIRLSKNTNLPVIIGNEKIQKGNTFGERINSVCEYSFAQGFENLILIGNDCLTLDSSTLALVENQLHQNEVVLGPSSDGGIYLLGISQKAFKAIDLANQLWQTSSLFFALREKIEQQCLSISILEIAADVDDIFQLEKELNRLSVFSFLRKKIANLLSFCKSIFFVFQQYTYFNFFQSTTLRGPPFHK